MTRIKPLCFYCKHEFSNKPGPCYVSTPQCDAFPDKIPDAIYDLGHDHRKPYPGDNGIRFEPVEEDSPNAYVLKSLPNFLKDLKQIMKWKD